MFRSRGTIGSPIFAEIEGGRGQNGTFLGDFTWNDPYGLQKTDICTKFLKVNIYAYKGILIL